MLRSFLHVLRDRLVVDEAVQLGAQLPMLVRGLYYDGWDPSRTPEKLSRDEFLDRFASEAGFPDALIPEEAVRAAVQTLGGRVSEGEIDEVLRSLPAHLRRVLE